MRLEASTAPKSLQASIPILSHELHSCLCKHSVAQSIPEGSVLQGFPGMLWLIGAAGSSVLEAGLFVSPQLSLVPMPRLAQGHTLPQALGKVICYGTCICTGALEWLWRLWLGGDQVWGTLDSFARFSPVHLSS